MSDQGDRSQTLSWHTPNSPVENVGYAVNFAEACLSLVQDYSEGRRAKGDTVQQLFHVFSEERGRVSPEIAGKLSRAFSAYFEMLEDFDKERTRAGREAPVLGEDHQRRAEEVAEGQALASTISKRRREDVSDGDQPHKRVLNEDLIPFGKGDVVDLPPDLAKTLEMQENYARPGYAKSLLLRDPLRPEFPTALWGDVIANAFIDLNTVFDSTNVDKQIPSPGNWSTAWYKYKDAVVFVYPHRERELRDYAAHIQGAFLVIPDAPERVLQYDRRVRMRVAESSSLRLSDFGLFYDEYLNSISSFFVSAPAGSTRHNPAQGGNRVRERLPEICKRYNFGSCNDPSACRYRHACLRCRNRGHPQSACKDAGSGGEAGTSQQK